MSYRILLLLTIAFVFTNGDYVSYKDYKVYNVVPTNKGDVKLLMELKENGHFSFWTDRIQENYEVKIMVKPEKQKEFEDHLTSAGLNIEVAVDNVQK